jgi:hypothetical protein
MEALLEEVVNLGRDNPEPAVRGLERIIASVVDLPAKRSHNILSPEDKHNILLRRTQKQSFYAIAVALEKSPSTIKSFCKKWEEHQKFELPMGRPPTINDDVSKEIIECSFVKDS